MKGTEVQISSYIISNGDVTYSIRDIVNKTVISLYGDRWLLDLSW